MKRSIRFKILVMCASLLVSFNTLSASEVTESTHTCVDEACKAQMRNLTELARNGSGRAAAFVAMAHATGDGLELNLKRAERFIKLGVRYDDPVATFMMANWLKDGFVLEQDLEKSAKMLDEAIELDYAPAMYQKAVSNFKSGDEEKAFQAVELLEKASEQNDMRSMFLLARLKQLGTYTEQNLVEAGDLFESLAKARYPGVKPHLNEIMSELSSQNGNDELLARYQSAQDIEVIEVTGQQLEIGFLIEGLVDRLSESGQYDKRSIGSRIRGVACGQSGSNCVSVDPKSGDRVD